MSRETERDLAAMVKVEKRAKETARVERDSLMQLVGELRTALHAPEDVDVREWARQVAAKAQRWDGVPWETIYAILFWLSITSHPCTDDAADLQQWYNANKGEVQR